VSRDLQEAQDILTEINKLSEDDASVEGDAPKDSGEDQIADLEEIVVQEALRPMLKEWLDKNLKGIVERAVTKEVKRISSGK